MEPQILVIVLISLFFYGILCYVIASILNSVLKAVTKGKMDISLPLMFWIIFFFTPLFGIILSFLNVYVNIANEKQKSENKDNE